MTRHQMSSVQVRIALLLVASILSWIFPVHCGGADERTRLDEVLYSGEVTPGFSCGCVSAKPQHSVAGLMSSGIPSPPSAIGEKRILLYRVDFADFIGAAISSNAAVDLIAGLSSYYRDMSFGQMSFAAVGNGSVVTDTLRLPEPSSAYDNNFTKFIAGCREAAVAVGYSLSDFDFDVVLTGARPQLVFGGISYVGGPGVWVGNGNFNVGVVGHELGHNLGLPHASFWYTGDQSSIGPGSKEEYGDPFDSMGVPGGSTSHFNARFKNLLGWIPDSDAPVVTSNGVYRITAHDHPAASGRRALRLVRNGVQDYWVEFRQFFNSISLTNGVGLRWAGHDATNTFLIDTTPGTPAGKQDSAVVIGRTFFDRCADIYITPVGKGGTVPESLDVVVNRGPFPDNVAPLVTVNASATMVATGAVVTLTASASDANGDALAYYWDFGDLNFGTNAATVQYAWPRDGEYVARCRVTDMKGGTASASVVMRVGVVTTFLVEGRVLFNGTPAEGVLVKAGANRFSYSDSDGTFHVSRLPAGRFTMTALLEAFGVLNAGFENPVTVGPNAMGLDFGVLPDALNAVTLVSAGSEWNYLDNGAAPDPGWTDVQFDESTWKTGRAKFGYGTGSEVTTVNYGPDPNNRYITTWFRQRFVVSDASVIHHLVFRLRRDDGAVVYLNGQELYRENLPTGIIQSGTTALADVNFTEEQAFFGRFVSPVGLLTGTNVLAVEIHQFRTNNTDLSFDLELKGVSEDPQALIPRLAAEHSGAELLVSWPANYSGWSLFTSGELTPVGEWLQSTAPVVTSNGLSLVHHSPTNARGFYLLRKLGFCGQ